MQNNNTEIEIKLSCPQNFNDIFDSCFYVDDEKILPKI